MAAVPRHRTAAPTRPHAPDAPRSIRLGAGHPLRAQRAGRGVGIAVIDSGVNPANPHVGRMAGTVCFAHDGARCDDALDRLGHGTAVVAAIQEKAPAAEIHVVKVFHERLATTATALVRAIDWAVEQRLRIINLSLGTMQAAHAAPLTAAVARAAAAGTLVVAAREHGERPCYPGSLSGVAGVILDWSAERGSIEVGVDAAGALFIAASGYPRPIPGVPPERNVRGISFAVANATGVLACVLEARPQLATARAIAAWIDANG